MLHWHLAEIYVYIYMSECVYIYIYIYIFIYNSFLHFSADPIWKAPLPQHNLLFCISHMSYNIVLSTEWLSALPYHIKQLCKYTKTHKVKLEWIQLYKMSAWCEQFGLAPDHQLDLVMSEKSDAVWPRRGTSIVRMRSQAWGPRTVQACEQLKSCPPLPAAACNALSRRCTALERLRWKQANKHIKHYLLLRGNQRKSRQSIHICSCRSGHHSPFKDCQ